MTAYDGAGSSAPQPRDPPAAVPSFRRALELYPDHARSLLGLGAAHAAHGDQRAADAAFKRAASAIDALRNGGRKSEATLSEAFYHVLCGRSTEAVDALKR